MFTVEYLSSNFESSVFHAFGVIFYCALFGYIHYEAPEEEQNFNTLLEFLNASEVREDDEDHENPVDMMFHNLEKKSPNHFAVRQHRKYKLAAGKTAKSILVSCGARLPVHVRCLIAETANIGQIPNLEKLVATIQSCEISVCLFLQAKSQLKAIYKDNTDTIIGNIDSQLSLGGTEPTTLKDLSQFLGKETIDMYNIGESRGNNPSYSMNYQKSGKDLMTVDEIAVMDGDKCILQLRGVRPFLSDKYDVTQHPFYKETG